VIGDGAGFTVMSLVEEQPVPNEKVTVVKPADTPVTTPVVEPTVAIAVEATLQVPAPDEVSVIVPPSHTFDGPDIAGGNECTVTVVVIQQPVPIV